MKIMAQGSTVILAYYTKLKMNTAIIVSYSQNKENIKNTSRQHTRSRSL